MSLTLTKGLVARWWKPAGQDEDETPSEFHIRPLTGPQMLEIKEHFNIEEQTIGPAGLLMAMQKGLRGWRGVSDDEGKDVPFSKPMMDRLPHDWIALIGAQIISDSVVTEVEEEN